MADSDNETTNTVHPNDLLMLAVREREPLRTVEFLLRHVEIHADDLMEIIATAIESKQVNSDVVCALIQHSPDVAEIQNEDGWFLLHIACCHAAPLEVVRLLIETNPAMIGIPSREDSRYPLHYACDAARPSIDIVRLITSRRPESVRDRDSDGDLPLHYIFGSDPSEDVILYLLECFPESAQVVSSEGYLPLFDACFFPRVVRKLVELYPESLTRVSPFGDLPLHEACYECAPFKVIQFLAKQYPAAEQHVGLYGRLPLHNLLVCDKPYVEVEMVQEIIDLFPSAVMVADISGRLPIHFSCMYAWSRATVELLMDSYDGNEIDYKSLHISDNFGRVPLHYAVQAILSTQPEARAIVRSVAARDAPRCRSRCRQQRISALTFGMRKS